MANILVEVAANTLAPETVITSTDPTAPDIAVSAVVPEVDVTVTPIGSDGVTSYNNLDDVPSTFPPSTHNHDDRYYTEAEMDASLLLKASTSDLADHLNDTSSAHDASAISFSPSGSISSTNAQAAIEEVASEAGGVGGDITAHLNDATDAHDASAISYAGSTNVAATDVESAIDELDTEKVASTCSISTTAPLTGGGDLSANRTLAVSAASESASGVVELATNAETTTGTDAARATHPAGVAAAIAAHTSDTSAAHAASAVSYAGGAGMSATDVEAAIDELATEKTDDSALTTHLNDTSDAHDASAISFSPTGTVAATDVQGAIAEVASEASGAAGYRTLVSLGSDVANATTALADVTGLSFAVSSGVMYRFQAMILYNASATSIGAKFSFNGPASPTQFGYTSQWSTSLTNNTLGNYNVYDDASTPTASAVTASNVAILYGFIRPSASGTLVVRFAAETGGTITVKAGSTLEYW